MPNMVASSRSGGSLSPGRNLPSRRSPTNCRSKICPTVPRGSNCWNRSSSTLVILGSITKGLSLAIYPLHRLLVVARTSCTGPRLPAGIRLGTSRDIPRHADSLRHRRQPGDGLRGEWNALVAPSCRHRGGTLAWETDSVSPVGEPGGVKFPHDSVDPLLEADRVLERSDVDCHEEMAVVTWVWAWLRELLAEFLAPRRA